MVRACENGYLKVVIALFNDLEPEMVRETLNEKGRDSKWQTNQTIRCSNQRNICCSKIS